MRRLFLFVMPALLALGCSSASTPKLKACELLTAADVRTATGRATLSDGVSSALDSTCTWEDTGIAISFIIEDGADARATFDAVCQPAGVNYKPVAGIGDEACGHDASSGQSWTDMAVYTKTRPLTFTLNFAVGTNQDVAAKAKVESLAKLVVGRL